MKKIILAIALFAAVSANAQSDGFFTSSYNNYEQNRTTSGTGYWAEEIGLPGHGLDYNQAAPLGSGLLLLAGMGIAYGARKKSSRQ